MALRFLRIFKEKLVEIDDLQKILEKATIANLVGENVVNWAVRKVCLMLPASKKVKE